MVSSKVGNSQLEEAGVRWIIEEGGVRWVVVRERWMVRGGRGAQPCTVSAER